MCDSGPTWKTSVKTVMTLIVPGHDSIRLKRGLSIWFDTLREVCDQTLPCGCFMQARHSAIQSLLHRMSRSEVLGMWYLYLSNGTQHADMMRIIEKKNILLEYDL